MHLSRSFFVGPTFFWKKRARERRRAHRWMRAILTRGNTEPMEFFVALHWFASGLILCFAPAGAVLGQPKFFGISLIGVALLGLTGLSLRLQVLRAAFGVCGFFLRFWMALIYFAYSWHDPQWISYLLGVIIMAWLFLRAVCGGACRRF